MPTATSLEDLTHDYGREIFARLQTTDPTVLTPAWLDERLMEWTMSEPAVKVQLFRFIDCLPLLHSARQITRHLREYFDQAGSRIPGWIRTGLRVLPEGGMLGGLLARTANLSARRMARRFIAGSNVEEALDAIAEQRRQSLAFTVDLLGEATITEAESDHYQGQYRELVEGLSEEVNDWPAVDLIDRDNQGPLPRVNVSVKFSSLYSQFDPIDPGGTARVVLSRLRPILLLARQNRCFVNIDMEQYAFKDLTLRIFRDVMMESEFRDWADVGIAVQAYLRDTEADLRELAEWSRKRGTPIWVRLVKGAYWDYETINAAQQHWPVPVFTRKWESDANYEKLTRFLLERHDLIHLAMGSHNVRSLAHGMALAETLGLHDRSYEIQMLYGMADPVKQALVSLGRRVRVYTPYGQLLPGMAYLVRRLLENTANDSFLRASFTENVPLEQLLMNPLVRGQESGIHAHEPSANGQPKPMNEPFTDFTPDGARAAMQQALAQVAKELGRTYPLVVDGREITTERLIASINPSHSKQIVGQCGQATIAQTVQAIAAAKVAFPAWRDTDAAERAAYLTRAAEEMRRRRFELSAWEVYECAKPWREADADIAEAIDFCDYYAREMLRLARPQRHDMPGEENYHFYDARGVVAVIAPWNFPLAILCGMTTAALVTGNTVVMKPAEQSSVVGAKLMEIFRAIGLPGGVLNYLPGIGEEIGPTLVNHPDVSMIAFTGSKGVGLTINREAANTPAGQDHVKRVLAEMGGKNAIIVDDDADLDEAVKGVVESAFGYAGQKCSACSRAIVLDPIYDRFVARVVEATKSLTVGPAENPGCGVPAVIDGEARQRILGAIEKGKSEGKLVHAGDLGALAEEGFFVAPHVFADVAPESTLAQEEIFGPVLAILRARDLDHALEIANGTRYALTGGLYTRSPEHITRIKREFRVGNLYINRKITGALVERQPFGGFKLSGIGAKAGGPDYLLQFVVPRTITENTLRRGFAPETEMVDTTRPS